jgi:hypothetical protein
LLLLLTQFNNHSSKLTKNKGQSTVVNYPLGSAVRSVVAVGAVVGAGILNHLLFCCRRVEIVQGATARLIIEVADTAATTISCLIAEECASTRTEVAEGAVTGESLSGLTASTFVNHFYLISKDTGNINAIGYSNH